MSQSKAGIGKEAGAGGGGAPAALVLALESGAGWTGESRFASSVESAIRGHLSFDRYFAAGRRATLRGAGDGAIEEATWDWMETSLHPLHGFLLGLDDPRGVLDCLNAYNVRDLGDSWEGEGSSEPRRRRGGEAECDDGPPRWILSSGSGEFRLYACRVSPDGFDDPVGCQRASLASIQFLAEGARRHRESGAAPPRSLSSIALHLGAERSAAAEAAHVFEREGAMPIEELSKRLGCEKRTLERELQAVGLTAGKLRLASMLVGATSQLHSAATLTQIAADQGFSDLAHMTRAFKASCGMSPSALRGARA